MRKGDSMFNEFREDIERWCDEGLTIMEMHSRLPEGYAWKSLYNYIRVNKIREGAWKRGIDKRNVCDKCEYCKRVKNIKGAYNVGNDRLCTKSWRMIQYSVRHCPKWCEKGEKDDNTETL